MMQQRLKDISDRIENACAFAGRDPDDVTMIAVTKNRNIDQIKQLIDCGVTHFGENRVQEASEKWDALKSDDQTLHMIGALQSNKVKQASALFDVLHTLDRPSLLKEMIKENWHPSCFIQVNTGHEDQKSGITPHDLEVFIASIPFDINGLMCIPPQDEPASLHFALLNNLARHHKAHALSMGMSNDFEAAIKCGATHIRLGRILFEDS